MRPLGFGPNERSYIAFPSGTCFWEYANSAEDIESRLFAIQSARTTESINALLIAPVGSVVAWPGPLSTIPNNWKLCNGEYLLASAFPDLLQVVQDYWGEYDGSGATQSFKLPDLRGVFLRGVNEERNDDYMDPEKDG